MRTFKTRLTELLGIEYPLIQGGLQWLGTAELAAAVSNAGALGSICARTLSTPELLRAEIRRARLLSSRPISVNLTISRYRSFNPDPYIDVIVQEAVPIVETAGDNPAKCIERLKASGTKVIHKVTSVRHARKAEELGADAITVVGYESGGQIGLDEVGLLALIPRVVDAVRLPVVGTGGADGRGLLAVLALGADGLLMGTRFVATEECVAHPIIKQRIVEVGETETVIIRRSIGIISRVIRTPYTERIVELERHGASAQEILPLIEGERSRKALLEGDLSSGPVSVGQSVGLVDRVMSAREVVDTIIGQATEGMDRLNVMHG